MPQQLHIDPALYDRAVKECFEALRKGDIAQASTLAMTAGVDAGVMGMDLSECPFIKPGAIFLNLELQWKWGHSAARTVNDNAQKGWWLL